MKCSQNSHAQQLELKLSMSSPKKGLAERLSKIMKKTIILKPYFDIERIR